MSKQDFLKEINRLNDLALMSIDTIQGVKSLNSKRRYALEMGGVFLSYEEALGQFKQSI